MDIDICGPSIPKMLGLEGEEIHQSNLGWSPVYVQVGKWAAHTRTHERMHARTHCTGLCWPATHLGALAC